MTTPPKPLRLKDQEQQLRAEFATALDEGLMVGAVNLKRDILLCRFHRLLAKATKLDTVEGAEGLALLYIDPKAVDEEESHPSHRNELQTLFASLCDKAGGKRLALELRVAAFILRTLNDFEVTSLVPLNSSSIAELSNNLAALSLASLPLERADIISQLALSGQLRKLADPASLFGNENDTAWHPEGIALYLALHKGLNQPEQYSAEVAAREMRNKWFRENINAGAVKQAGNRDRALKDRLKRAGKCVYGGEFEGPAPDAADVALTTSSYVWARALHDAEDIPPSIRDKVFAYYAILLGSEPKAAALHRAVNAIKNGLGEAPIIPAVLDRSIRRHKILFGDISAAVNIVAAGQRSAAKGRSPRPRKKMPQAAHLELATSVWAQVGASQPIQFIL